MLYSFLSNLFLNGNTHNQSSWHIENIYFLQFKKNCYLLKLFIAQNDNDS